MKNEPELYVGRCNGKTLNTSKRMLDRAIWEALNGKKPDSDFSCVEIRIPDEAFISDYRDDFISAVINQLKHCISNKAADILSMDDEYIMSLSPSYIDTDTFTCTQNVRIRLIHKPLVRCKDCLYCMKTFDGKLMCRHPSFIHRIDTPDGYCHNGIKPNIENYLVKEEKSDEEN